MINKSNLHYTKQIKNLKGKVLLSQNNLFFNIYLYMAKISRPLLKSEIIIAQDESNSAAEAARKLDVSYNTYKKYAKLYDIMERCKCTDSRVFPKFTIHIKENIH